MVQWPRIILGPCTDWDFELVIKVARNNFLTMNQRATAEGPDGTYYCTRLL